ncbi:MAG: hypothetical protein IJW15_01065 [Clostridia bacterium]|nr:hypothetical protein [Clostridia bacterium]
MTSKELNMKLIEYMPEIRQRYVDEVSWQEQDETGSHIVFGDVLVPYIIEKTVIDDDQSLKRIFEAVEKIFSLDDDYANEVIILSVLEAILYKEILNKKVIKYMGLNTKKAFDKMEKARML